MAIKKIWTYWHDQNVPAVVAAITNSWKAQLVPWGWQVTVLSQMDIPECAPPGLKALLPQHQADWMRLFYLKEHGGLWLDASVIVNSPDELGMICGLGYDMVVFREAKRYLSKKPPVIENFFIMARPECAFVKLWFDMYDQACRQGFKEFAKRLCKVIDTQGRLNQRDTYFMQHACALYVMQTHPEVVVNMLVLDSRRSVYKLHEDINWNPSRLVHRLRQPAACKVPLIKLTRGDRAILSLRDIAHMVQVRA